MIRLLISVIAFGLAGGSLAAQDSKPFKVRWYGQSFFEIETPGGKRIATDPHLIPAFGRTIVPADIVTISHEHNDHNVLDAIENPKAARVFHGVKEEKGRSDWQLVDERVGSVRIRNIASYHDNENGASRGKNSIFIFETDGLVICHLGDVGHLLNDEQIKSIGPVDVLMIPVGGTYTINGEQAKKIVEKIKPRQFIFPMHYGLPNYDDLNGPDEFLDSQQIKINKVLLGNEFVIQPGLKPAAPTIVLLGAEAKKKK